MRREGEKRPDQMQNAIDRDPDNPQWKQEKPDEWIRDQRQYRDRPADHQQQAPKKKCEHDRVAPFMEEYDEAGEMVPSAL